MSSKRISRLALASLAFGLLSPFLSLLAILPALGCGLYGIRAINGDPEHLRGRRLAGAGMILGAFSTVLTVLGCLALAVLQVNAESRRAACTNNLRGLGEALNGYHDVRGHFPPAVVPNDHLPPERRLSWFVEVLPVEAAGPAKKGKDLAGQLDPAQPWDAPANQAATLTLFPAWLCPAWETPRPALAEAWTTYPGLAGLGPDAARLPLSSKRAGLFGYERSPTRRDVHAGISSTMMVVETALDLGPWAAGGLPTVRDLDPQKGSPIGPGRSLGGFHQGGMNVLWVDGSVRFVPLSTDPAILRAQATLTSQREE